MNSSLRILHVLGELKPSGAETMLRIAAPLFAAQGVDAEIVSTGSEIGDYAPQLAEAGYKVHHIPFSKTPVFFFELYKLMRAGRYDVFHLHTERANFWIGLLALSMRPLRVLQTVHNNFAFTGNLRWRRKVQRQVLHAFGLIAVSISPSVKKTELAKFGLRTQLVQNWYDSNRFTPPTQTERRQAREALGIRHDETVIVTVGNCSEIKNHQALMEALAKLPVAICPIYLHVGIEEDGHPERNLAQRLGIAERVRFLGALDDVRPALYAADIFVMPSLVEGLGIAALEALATGLPALFADVLGLGDFRDKYSGLCYAEPTPQSLHDALFDLLMQSDELRRSWAENYPLISKKTFGVERGVCEYIDIYYGRSLG